MCVELLAIEPELGQQFVDLELALQAGALPHVLRRQPCEIELRELGKPSIDIVLNRVLLLQVFEVVEIAELADQAQPFGALDDPHCDPEALLRIIDRATDRVTKAL